MVQQVAARGGARSWVSTVQYVVLYHIVLVAGWVRYYCMVSTVLTTVPLLIPNGRPWQWALFTGVLCILYCGSADRPPGTVTVAAFDAICSPSSPAVLLRTVHYCYCFTVSQSMHRAHPPISSAHLCLPSPLPTLEPIARPRQGAPTLPIHHPTSPRAWRSSISSAGPLPSPRF